MSKYEQDLRRRMELVRELERLREEGVEELRARKTIPLGDRCERYDLDELAEHIQAYEERAVLEKCPMCANRHLPIATVRWKHFVDPRPGHKLALDYLTVWCSCGYSWSEPVKGDDEQ